MTKQLDLRNGEAVRNKVRDRLIEAYRHAASLEVRSESHRLASLMNKMGIDGLVGRYQLEQDLGVFTARVNQKEKDLTISFVPQDKETIDEIATSYDGHVAQSPKSCTMKKGDRTLFLWDNEHGQYHGAAGGGTQIQ